MSNNEFLPGLRKVLAGTAAATALMVTADAHAVIVLNFEGLGNEAPIGNYYGGGAGPNYGITFGADSLAIISAGSGGTGNFADAPGSNTVAFFLGGPGDVMNVAAGFSTGFSFYYSGSVDQPPGSVNVYSGLSGGGSLLASLSLPGNTPANGCQTTTGYTYCNWDPVGVNFAGSAESVVFSGAANYIAFDEITLGSATPPPPTTPEPATMALLSSGLLGLAALRKRRKRE